MKPDIGNYLKIAHKETPMADTSLESLRNRIAIARNEWKSKLGILRRSDIAVATAASLVFALMTFFGLKIVISNVDYSSWSNNSIPEAHALPLAWVDVIAFFVSLFVAFLLIIAIRLNLSKLSALIISNRSIYPSQRHFQLIALTILICWLPYIIAYAPGIIPYDTMNPISQAMGDETLNTHYPVMYTIALKGFLFLGNLLGNINIGILVLTVLQCVLIAMTTAYMLCWLLKHNIRREIVLICLVLTCLHPSFGKMAVTLWRDQLFSCALLLLSLKLFDMCLDRSQLMETRTVVEISLLTMFTVFLRNNGSVVVCFVLLVLLLVAKKAALKTAGAMLFVILLSAFIQGPCYRA
ncbi:MAG: DUF6020 family protein, partial [Coriobacteriales bacterium]|nr:DUF6020 family protein [Coriobacteriales bacterium]